MGPQSPLFLLSMLAVLHLALAGCPAQIFDCAGRNLCTPATCGAGLVCRVDNCGKCKAVCDPPGTVHIMSMTEKGPSTPAAGSSSQRVCQCPEIYGPVCGSDGKVYDNKCYAECAGATISQQKPDATGKCSPSPASPSKPAQATSPARPVCACPRNYSPVCGSDGVAYNNKCLAECAEVKVTEQRPDSNRKCPSPAGKPSGRKLSNNFAAYQGRPVCPCPRNYMPVCGSDGKVYDNKCLAECAGVATAVEQQPDANGKCPTATGSPKPSGSAKNQNNPVCRCPRLYKPVCGSDGVAYDNECLAKCAGAQVTSQPPDSNRKCPSVKPGGRHLLDALSQQQGRPGMPVCSCPKILMPVCGADGQKYDNQCLAQCAGVAVTANKPDANNKCPSGADGSSTQAAGPSSTQGGRPCACPYILKRVCGSDGAVYSNECLARCAGVTATGEQPDASGKCSTSVSGTSKSVSPAAPGPNPPSACACAKDMRQVCGSDGKVYNNPCMAKCAGVEVSGPIGTGGKCDASAGNKPQGSQGPNPTGQGSRPCPCPRIYKPVCGEDGKVYPNQCVASCSGAKIAQSKMPVDGKCV